MSYTVTISPAEDIDLRDLMCGFGRNLVKDDDSFIIHVPPRTMVFEEYGDWIAWRNRENNELASSETLKRARQLTLN